MYDVLNNLTDMLRSHVHNLGPDEEHSGQNEECVEQINCALLIVLKGLYGLRLLDPSVDFIHYAQYLLLLLCHKKSRQNQRPEVPLTSSYDDIKSAVGSKDTDKI